MKTRVGRTRDRFRFPLSGFRAFLLPALIFSLLLCACLSGQTSGLPLPHPIPPPAEDPPPARRTVSSDPAPSSGAQTASSGRSAGGPSTIYVSSKPLRDISGNVIQMNGAYGGGTVLLPVSYTPKQNEFRGVWVATSFNLDFAKQATAAEFQKSFRTLASNVAALGFNTIMFQVRPSCDAFYRSSINPWSRWLTGTEGKPLDGGFDPMAFMIAESHRHGLKFYAWLNPYRIGQTDTSVSTSAYLQRLSAGNFARRNPGLVARWNNKKTNSAVFFLDPGRTEVVAHVANTVREVLERYRPDGIVFDDYFYPDGCDTACDAATFRRYAKKGQSLGDWRRANTELLIRSVAGIVRAFNRLNGTSIPFGVSPVGIWANRSEAMPDGSPTKGVEAHFQSYTDIRKWVKNSWIDFVIPQVNWGFANAKAPFAGVVNWWADLVRGTNVKLYIGIGVYQAGVAAGMESPSELSNQVLYLILRKEVSGAAFFAMRHCLKPENNAQKTSLRTIFGTYWRNPPPAK